ncbi:MAG: hypothetical protein ACT4PL_08170 [Phycisphaerales bacterium]
MPSTIAPAIADSRWIRSLVKLTDEALSAAFPTGEPLDVAAFQRIASGFEVVEYGPKLMRHRSVHHKVDLLITERMANDRFVPRVAIECLMGVPTTRTAQSLDSRVSQLKRINPTMRFGAFVAGITSGTLPARLVKGAPSLDFIACYEGVYPTPAQWPRVSAIFSTEIAAARALESITLGREIRSVGPLRFLHRGLTIE